VHIAGNDSFVAVRVRRPTSGRREKIKEKAKNQGHTVDALVPSGDEGRDKLR